MRTLLFFAILLSGCYGSNSSHSFMTMLKADNLCRSHNSGEATSFLVGYVKTKLDDETIWLRVETLKVTCANGKVYGQHNPR